MVEEVSGQESIQAGGEESAVIVKEITTVDTKPSVICLDGRGVMRATPPPKASFSEDPIQLKEESLN